jgi:hypothetical protein
MVERLKIADTPYQIDLDYKRGLIEQLPATKEDLAALKKKYGRTYHFHIGKFLHIQQVTQFMSGFTVTHLAQFTVAPNKAAFVGLT